MDQIELGRVLGYLQARQDGQEEILQDHGRRLSRLEKRRPHAGVPWKDLLPIAYGVTILGLAVAGKMSIVEAVRIVSP